ncbi:MAG TPA: ATP-binding cassette domain-containing protein [Actinobacteria bacterium]|nr:ATP-binding cassette domain-containing protein [Actinomycetota bacterium]
MVEVVALKSIRKSYHGEPILEIEEMSLGAGEILTISGPNGAGKSTLLRIIGLLEPPDPGGGQLSILGQKPTRSNHTFLRRRMAVVFQAPYMFNRSVYENIAMGLRWRQLGTHEASQRVGEVVKLLEIDFLDRQARELSRGQAQRVALARALVVRPEILLLDEPLSALDANIRAKLLTKLKITATEAGRSAIYVTHDEKEAELIADQRLTLVGRKINRSFQQA